ncbi:protein FAM110C [Parambassis ranga]|uniref:Protein FAM110C n=1 Tax=Parambassis ranga TaxID=210632 RepID=A0A6P7HPJ9_9TELE|nr:protein FAM110C [Parambassis ranga]
MGGVMRAVFEQTRRNLLVIRAQAKNRLEWNFSSKSVDSAGLSTLLEYNGFGCCLITTMETSDTIKILGKGPEYLRKQMELESEAKGRMSAVERLALSKPKYVKSQQVVNSTQEPVISIGSASVSSTGSSNRSSNRSGNLLLGGNPTEHVAAAHGCSSPGEVRRSSSKKRPDSLLLYRQKCELLSRTTHDRQHRISRKLLLSSVNKNASLPEATNKEFQSEGNKERITTPEGTAKECSIHVVTSQSKKRNGVTEQYSNRGIDSGTKLNAGVANQSSGLLTVPESERRSGKGVSRSHSDISSRYSKNFADFDAFFKYCGLDGEVIESLGRGNFSAHSDEIAMNIRSVSISTSDDGFSRNSDDSDGLHEDELQEKIREGTSVIERNARIIKWLYSCKNATETGKKLRDLD